jgi:tetratricopeptide (TPR) repeat protein
VAEYPSSEQDPNSAESRRSGGVTIDADQVNIGGDVVGRDKIVIQQTLGKRFWTIAAIIAVVVVIGLGAAIAILNQPPPMPDGFNVAVAEFVEQDTNGTLAVTKDSRTLSDWLFEAVKKESEQLPASLKFAVRGPSQIGSIAGADNACKAAKSHNATILIYGVITATDGGYQVRPEFCVNDKSFGYGSEVAGPDRLGQPVPYAPPLSEPGTLKGINEKLDTRLSVLQHMVKGLAYYYVSDYDSALSEFRQAADDPNWSPKEGQEVVYSLIGAAQLHRDYLGAPPEQRNEILQNASDSFARARQLNPNYARSYLGLGSIALQQAMIDPNHIDEEKLIEAYSWYSRSLSSTDQLPASNVPIKAALGLGQIHLAGYTNQLLGWSADQARSNFTQVISAYEANPSPDLAWLAGHAYCELGYLAGLENGDWPTMSTQCHKAVDVLKSMPGNPPLNWIARYWSWIGRAEKNGQHIEAAKNAYREAVKIGKGLVGSSQHAVSAEELAEWQAALDQLEQ